MDFEDILKDVGGFGLYQKILVTVFLIPSSIVIPWFSMNSIFSTHTPDHWCYVPEVSDSNLSLDLQKQLIRPSHDSSCSMYDVNYSQILLSRNWTANPEWPTRYCNKGWQYDTSDYDATSVTRWNMVCKDSHYSNLVLSMIFIGNVFCTPLYGFMSDRLGRKPTFLILAALVAVTEIGTIFTSSFAFFLLLRAVNGSHNPTLFAIGYMILLELVIPDFRARMNGVAMISWTVGLCLLPLVAYLTADWMRLSIVVATSAAALLLYFKFLPESPRWLISRERYDEAAAHMRKISKMNGKKAHEGNQLVQKIQKLGDKIKLQDGQVKASPTDFFTYPSLRKRFLLFTITWVGTSIPYYGLQMNVKNLAGSEFLNYFLLSVIEVPAHLITWFFTGRIGRRWCSVCGFLISTTACVIPIIFSSEYAMIGVVASLFAKAGASSNFMTLYQQGPELFPTSLRGVGMGMSSTIGLGSTLLGPYIIYLAKFGTSIPFMIFSVIALISGICASFLPETLNQKLPQTVTDTENFEEHVNFFSCCQQPEEKCDSETVKSCRALSILSAADLSSSLKNVISPEQDINNLVLIKMTSTLSECEVLDKVIIST